MAESGLGWEFYLGTLVGAGVGVLAASASAATVTPSTSGGARALGDFESHALGRVHGCGGRRWVCGV